jgi:hypothetical protein
MTNHPYLRVGRHSRASDSSMFKTQGAGKGTTNNPTREDGAPSEDLPSQGRCGYAPVWKGKSSTKIGDDLGAP